MLRHDVLFATSLGLFLAAAPTLATGIGPVDATQSDRSPPVAAPGPIDARIVGAWDVWIPGSVYYLSDGRQVTQHYQAGAAMNRLEIAADGRYRWGARSGRLEEVQPWHYQPGRRYFRVVHASGNEYEFYHGDGDKLVVLFGGVGGHAATGSRIAGATAAATAAPTPTATSARGARAVGARVEILWGNAWYPGRIQRADGDRYLVSYDGYGSNWEEWVDATRLRGGAVARPAPSPVASPTAPTAGAGNPLGVEWRSAQDPALASVPAPSPAPADTATTADAGNPLGVEWATAQRPATSAPAAPQSPSTPVPPPQPQPQPQQPQQPQAPQPPLPPQSPTVPPEGRPDVQVAGTHPIADRWKYIAATYHGSDGRIDDALGVDGMLHLKDNGEYEQTLVIGGIANVIRGTWDVSGDRVTTRYTWRGEPASDVMQLHLRADGKQLTLVRQGSPTVYYTLDRIE